MYFYKKLPIRLIIQCSISNFQVITVTLPRPFGLGESVVNFQALMTVMRQPSVVWKIIRRPAPAVCQRNFILFFYLFAQGFAEMLNQSFEAVILPPSLRYGPVAPPGRKLPPMGGRPKIM